MKGHSQMRDSRENERQEHFKGMPCLQGLPHFLWYVTINKIIDNKRWAKTISQRNTMNLKNRRVK